MRLWHKDLIHYLPRQQLLGQHRECCALRGKGWGKKHSVVNYVFRYPYITLFLYHIDVIREIESRGYYVNANWKMSSYRGKEIKYDMSDFTLKDNGIGVFHYGEHNDKYLKECILNLQAKGAKLINGTSIEEMLMNLAIKGV